MIFYTVYINTYVFIYTKEFQDIITFTENSQAKLLKGNRGRENGLMHILNR